MSAKVSVLVPVYNVAPYLRRCLDSLLNQTLKDIEIIVVDDASTDGSRDIIGDYKDDERVKTVFLTANEGLNMARLHGFEISEGEFIACLDSDDWVEPETYSTLYDLACRENADIVRFSSRTYDERGLFESDDPFYSFRFSDDAYFSGYDYLKKDACMSMRLHFVSKKLWEDAAPWMRKAGEHVYGADNLSLSVLAFRAGKVVSISTRLYCRYARKDSITGLVTTENTRKHIIGRARVMAVLKAFLKSQKKWDEYSGWHRELAWKNLSMILHRFILLIDEKESREALMDLLLQSFGADAFSWVEMLAASEL